MFSTALVKEIDAAKGSDDARIAVEVRNALIFALTGGGEPLPPIGWPSGRRAWL
jgi:hypothetical protein